MRPLDIDLTQDDAGAPVSAMTPELSFWDHLARTRRDEYEAGDILTACPLPDPHDPVHAVTIPARPARDTFMPGATHASLAATLHAHDRDDLPPDMDARPAVAPGLTAPLRMPAAAAHVQRRPRKVRDSRTAYRLQRFWLTPVYRKLVTLGLPLVAIAAFVTVLARDPQVQAFLQGQYDAAYSAFVDRPNFQITTLRLPDLAPELDAAIRAIVAPELPKSSFRLDLPALRARIEALDAIRFADLRLTGDGALAVTLTHRVPAILWRTDEGLQVLDAEGHRVGFATSRDAVRNLPLIAGDGAHAQVGEALALFEAAAGLGPRIVGLVRMGERRWDVVLDRDQRIRLPETAALAAMEKAVALHQAQDMMARDILVADLRNPARPVLQISDGAQETLRASRSFLTEANSR